MRDIGEWKTKIMIQSGGSSPKVPQIIQTNTDAAVSTGELSSKAFILIGKARGRNAKNRAIKYGAVG